MTWTDLQGELAEEFASYEGRFDRLALPVGVEVVHTSSSWFAVNQKTDHDLRVHILEIASTRPRWHMLDLAKILDEPLDTQSLAVTCGLVLSKTPGWRSSNSDGYNYWINESLILSHFAGRDSVELTDATYLALEVGQKLVTNLLRREGWRRTRKHVTKTHRPFVWIRPRSALTETAVA